MNRLRPYQQLADFYHKDWGDFALLYLKLFDRLADQYGFKPTSVLDLACGTGVLSAWLAGKGVQVTGLDISPEMIRQARQINPAGEFYRMDITDFDLGRQFDAITCTFDSLNYLLNTGLVEKTFCRAYRHLNPGGFFLFDVNTPLLYRQKHFGEIVHEANGVEFKQILPDYNPVTRIALTLFDFGDNRVEEHRQKAYTDEDIRPLLEKCGFMVTTTFQTADGDPVTEQAFRIFYIARK